MIRYGAMLETIVCNGGDGDNTLDGGFGDDICNGQLGLDEHINCQTIENP